MEVQEKIRTQNKRELLPLGIGNILGAQLRPAAIRDACISSKMRCAAPAMASKDRFQL
jgi:hypothetical protein